MRVGHWLAPCGLTKHMALGAIFDAGGNVEAARRAAASIGSGWSLRIEEVHVSSVRCLSATVVGGRHDDSRPLTMADLTALIAQLDMTIRAREMMMDAYRHLFSSEAAVHGTPAAEARLHESGIASNLALLAAACAGLAALNLEEITVGQIAVGSGFVESSTHGVLPIPPPAVVHLLTSYELTSGPLPGERVTPTSAALIRATASPRQMPPISVQHVGRGADTPFEKGGFASLLIGSRP